MKFLLNWNDEYLQQRIVDGPFHEAEILIKIRFSIIKSLMLLLDLTEAEAKVIYDKKAENEELYPDIDLNIYDLGASLRYGSGYEDRFEIVDYKLPNME